MVKETKLLRYIIKNSKWNFIILDGKTGEVYARNMDYEAGTGLLYDLIGSIGRERVGRLKKPNKNPNIAFRDEFWKENNDTAWSYGSVWI